MKKWQLASVIAAVTLAAVFAPCPAFTLRAQPRLTEAQAAALQVVQGLEDGEAFNVIDYSDSIASFAPSRCQRTGRTWRRRGITSVA